MGSMYWVWASTLKDWDRAGCGVVGALGGETIQCYGSTDINSYCNVCVCMCLRIRYLNIITNIHTYMAT